MSDDKDGISKGMLQRNARIVSPLIRPTLRKRPHINTLLGDAYSILYAELRALMDKQDSGQPLDGKDTAKFHKLTDALAKLAREEREQEAKVDPAALDDAALLAYVDRAREVLQSSTVVVTKEDDDDEV